MAFGLRWCLCVVVGLCVTLLTTSLLLLSNYNGGPGPKRSSALASNAVAVTISRAFHPVVRRRLRIFCTLAPSTAIRPVCYDRIRTVGLLLTSDMHLTVAAQRLAERRATCLGSGGFFPMSMGVTASNLTLVIGGRGASSLVAISRFGRVLAKGIAS